ncbi:2-5A-dependent ribonuclease-like [Lissotriton helveticus]
MNKGEDMGTSMSAASSLEDQEIITVAEEMPSAACGIESQTGLESQVNTALYPAGLNKCNLLWKAVVEGKSGKVRLLLEQGADINSKVKYGWTPLLQAMHLGWDEIVNLLLEMGAGPLVKKDNGGTPFIIAGMLGNEEYLKHFLSKGANINEQDNNGFTALMEAALHGHEQATKFLLGAGADVNVVRSANDEGKSRSTGGQTALMDAAKNGHGGIVRMLLAKGADVNHQDLHGRSALHHALSSSDPTVISILLDFGVEINMRDREGKTAFFMAVEKKKPSMVEALLSKCGGQADVQDNTGRSALQVAVSNSDYQTVKLLLENGADTKNRHLIQEALTKYNPSLVKLLLNYGATVDPNDMSTNWTAVSKCWGQKLKELHDLKRPLKGKLEIFINDNYKIKSTSGVGVYLGIYDDHEVAVKITLKEGGNERFLQEQRCLNYFQGRSHTMKLLGAEDDDYLHYLCLMLCENSIEGHTSMCPLKAKNIMKNVFQALEDLHQSNFAHQDVCPSNILIDYRGECYLADFDKSLRFEDCAENVKRELVKGDMKGLADVVQYMTGAVGQDIDGLPPDEVFSSVEVKDLIQKLLNPDEEHQSIKDFFKHPFFWSRDSKFNFLQEVGNEPDIKTSEKCTLVVNLNRPDAIEGKTFNEWTKRIDKRILDDMNLRNPKYPYKDTVESLLKFIRNMGAHFQEKKEIIKEIIKDPGEYFLNLFPDLTLYIYETIRVLEDKKRLLDPYGISLPT